MTGWQFDPAKTQERYARLQEYYREKGLNADQFACVHFAQCSGSQKQGRVNQYKGGTAGLMSCYDVTYNGTPIRVFIIGKETAHNPILDFGVAPNFDARSKDCLNAIFAPKRNNHITGTLLTLQRVFEVNSDYVYACYALGNLLRCGFQKEEIAQNVSSLTDTRIMRDNCVQYLIDEINILEPTLIITQGAWAIVGKPALVDRLAQTLGTPKRLMSNTANGKYGLYEFPGFMLITSHHPARLNWWKTRYAPDSLWPMLNHLKATGYLPTISPEDAEAFEELILSSGVVNEF